jgi:hypothetical protein
VEDATLAAVFVNVGTLVAFQVGAQDAESISAQLGGDVTVQDLTALPKHQAYVRLLIDGQPSRPFSMRTLPPPAAGNGERSAVIRRCSRRRYARPVAEAEAEIREAYAGV